MAADSLMMTETAEAPARAAHQVAANRVPMRELGARLRRLSPPFAATLARGSSDQAAGFAKTLFELHAATPTLSHSPSIGSLYHATSPQFADVPLFVISQSGRSPDLIAAAEDARRAGATVIAIVNNADSPLADLADVCVPVHAGAETSVAATKSFIATLVALTHLAAEWSEDRALLGQLDAIGAILNKAIERDWSVAAEPLAGVRDLLVLGRGYTLPIAGEAALKFKEVAGIHAEPFSIAEVAHGPMTLVGGGDPVLVFGPVDTARAGLRERIEDFARRDATVIATGRAEDIAAAAIRLPGDEALHPALGAIASIQSFYALAHRIAVMRGRDPDHPPHLSKVTETL